MTYSLQAIIGTDEKNPFFTVFRDIEKKVSKIDELIKEKKQKLDANTKYMLDIIKIIGRNIFYLTFSDFRKKYDDCRDDLVIFQQLIRANGVIKYIDGQIIFDLYPEMELTPKNHEYWTRGQFPFRQWTSVSSY